jgi:adenylate cyclase
VFTALALAALFETSWLLFFSPHWGIDAATPGAGLALVFAAGAIARSVALQETRSKLRVAFCDSLPPGTIEEIVRNPQSLSIDGENRDVTYLVCEIRQPAELAGKYRRDPQSFTRLIGEVLSPLVDQVLAHGGTIDRQTADGFAAFWNAPLDDSAHALHACEAASGMAAMVERVNEYVTGLRGPDDKFIPPLEISVGIATGPVIAGDFGGRRMAYSVHGEAVTLAARIQALSPQYGPAVIVSEDTKRAAQQAFAFLEVDYIAVGKGDAPVRLYAMLGRPATRSSPKFKALNTFHEHIFKALRGRQWAGARELIAQCRNLSGASPALYDLHLARIQYFENNPPPTDWDGAFRPILK